MPKTRRERAGQLSHQQELFVKHYLITLNGTKAAEHAGYKPKNAAVQASGLLRKAKILSAVQKALAARMEDLDISADRVLAELAKLAFSNLEDYVVHDNGEITPDFSKVNRDQMAAVQEVTVDQYAGGAGDGQRKEVMRTRFKLADKGLNLERLGRYLKLFTDKVEVDGSPEFITRLLARRKRVGK